MERALKLDKVTFQTLWYEELGFIDHKVLDPVLVRFKSSWHEGRGLYKTSMLQIERGFIPLGF